MRHSLWYSLAAATLATTACGRSIDVHTVVSPDAGLSRFRTFQIMALPRERGPRPATTNDPMLVNSITNRALRNDIAAEFTRLGYVRTDAAPDFLVAYYASTREKLDVTYWDYGYTWRPRWWVGRARERTFTQYTEGTVIVDVIDGKTKELIWRGQGKGRVSDVVEEYLKDLRETVAAILERFPSAEPAAPSGG